MDKVDFSELLEVTFTNKDNDVYSLSKKKNIILVFLRHFGCVFCRQTMADLSKIKEDINAKGAQIVFVHMSEDDIADDYFEKFGLKNMEHISDPDLSLYQYFGLYKGTFAELYNLNVWFKGALKTFKYGTTVGKELGDHRQMPGAFLIDKGRVLKEFEYKGDITSRPFTRSLDDILSASQGKYSQPLK
jgi:thiol-disulfide isomerase/thioredoxin